MLVSHFPEYLSVGLTTSAVLQSTALVTKLTLETIEVSQLVCDSQAVCKK